MKAAAFVVATGVLAWISRASLRAPRSHGFCRFFAWEAILALFLLNMDHWFRDPLAWHQIIAWTLLCASLAPLVSGIHALRTRGRPTARRADDSSLLAFERTTTLVTSGIYRYIRHPLYSALLLLAWGIFFKLPSLPGLALAVIATVFLRLTAKADEDECVRYFGAPYQAYMKKTKRFIPFVY